MSAKGIAAPEVVLQAVIMSFDTQGINADKLVQAAQHYKEIIKQKNDDFINGAETEKSNQLQKRQNVLQTHSDNIEKLQQQIIGYKEEMITSVGAAAYNEQLTKLPLTSPMDLAGDYFLKSLIIGLFLAILMSVILRKLPKPE